MKRKTIYDGVFDNSHTPMLIIDGETGEIRDGDPAACYYYGYDWDGLLDLNIADINILNQQQISVMVCFETLIDRFEGDQVLLNEVIDEVVSSRYENEFFGGLEEHIKSGDVEKLSRQIHKFKGSISHFQVYSINMILHEMKVCCKSCDLSRINELLKGLRLEYARLRACLLRYKEKQNLIKSD